MKYDSVRQSYTLNAGYYLCFQNGYLVKGGTQTCFVLQCESKISQLNFNYLGGLVNPLSSALKLI